MIMLRTLMKHIFLLATLLGGFALVTYAESAGQKGFINIDCGQPHISNHSDEITGLVYISDTTLVDGGESKFLLPKYYESYPQQFRYLRSFPQGIRNCYKINDIANDTQYLIRATFLYGNYDGKDILPEFNLHLGTDLWDRIKFDDAAGNYISSEILHIPTRNYLEICLENTGSGTPFISVIELRPVSKGIYQTAEGSLVVAAPLSDTGASTDNRGYRWPDDIYDRFWRPCSCAGLMTLSSGTGNVDSSGNDYHLPSAVMNTAITSVSQQVRLEYLWQPEYDYNNSKYYVYMHFAELVQNQSRQFRIYLNERLWYNRTIQPAYLKTFTVSAPLDPIADSYHFSISATDDSTLPPILNAVEIYRVKQFPQSQTKQIDVEALTNIKSTYRVTKNWQGDPCVPKKFLWKGVTCSYADNSEELIRIISLNLSSSGLTGKIPPSISNLTKIQILDLSNNSFTGKVPEFLSRLPKLTVLHLEKNNFTGSLPIGLLQKWKDGLLSISMDGNIQHLCASSVSCKKKKKMNNFVVPVVASVVGIFVGLLTASAIWWGLKRKPHDAKSTFKNGPLASVKRQFTFSEILKITNNLQKILGKGGFGTVYHGKIGDAQVAVKMLSESSVQGYQEFFNEVQLLMRVHHRNLTSLVGYCNDKTDLGLIYEYMAKGNLQEALSDESSEPLNWEDRLRITMDAAQGLQYLHSGCRPPIVHRDVKTTNILLNQYMQAKLCDFGLSKAFPSTDSGTTHIITRVAGTHGYLDPEYHRTSRLNEKSDVYSFGVVMLEIITGRHAVLHESQERIRIGDWVSFRIENGDITSIIDPRLEGNFDTNSAWKVVEIAIKCISPRSIQRPTMNQVVAELKECLVTGNNSAHANPENPTNEINPLYSITEMSGPSAR